LKHTNYLNKDSVLIKRQIFKEDKSIDSVYIYHPNGEINYKKQYQKIKGQGSILNTVAVYDESGKILPEKSCTHEIFNAKKEYKLDSDAFLEVAGCRK
jgi:antitoxin component YwqK of YwqJK toxin-antitoxin module